MSKLNFEDWKKECKKIIYEQTEGVDVDEGMVKHNMEFVDDWDLEYEAGYTPKEAVDEANEHARDHFLDNQ